MSNLFVLVIRTKDNNKAAFSGPYSTELRVREVYRTQVIDKASVREAKIIDQITGRVVSVIV